MLNNSLNLHGNTLGIGDSVHSARLLDKTPSPVCQGCLYVCVMEHHPLLCVCVRTPLLLLLLQVLPGTQD
jgi:hypothetical protein